MQKLLLAVSLAVLMVSAAVAQTLSGTISADETWSGTVTVTGDVIVDGGTLNISAGTKVMFAETNDNVVYGDATRIKLVAKGGGIQAIGSSGSEITFTTAASTPASNKWNKIQFIDNGTKSKFSHCIVEYAFNGFGIENSDPDSATQAAMGPSSPAFDNCEIRNTSATGVFGGHGTSATFDKVTIHDCNNGFFFNGAGSVSFTNCTVYNVSSGFILAGMAGYTNAATIDHLTMYNVDMMIAGDPKWWTGYGIFCTNDAGTLTLTNSIMVMSTLANMKIGSWTVTENHNCWDTGMFGLMNIEDGVPDGTDLVGDLTNGNISPLFVDAANGDLRLVEGSPCLSAGADGKNMGSYDGPGIASSIVDNFRPVAMELMAHGANPFNPARGVITFNHPDARVTITALNGAVVRTLRGTAAWDGTDRTGRTVQPGLYLVSVTGGAAAGSFSLVVSR